MAGRAVAQDFSAELAKCAAIGDSGQRLACYDAFARRPAGPAPKPELGREQLPDPEAAVPGDDSLTAGVTRVALTAIGRVVLFLDNGQIWQQIDGDSARYVADGHGAGAKVTISHGLFGSYNLQFAGTNAMYKVRRVK